MQSLSKSSFCGWLFGRSPSGRAFCCKSSLCCGLFPAIPNVGERAFTVLLVDDVLTTGATFIALRRKLIAHGAKFVIGMFLAKTIAFEDERKDLSINDYTNPTTSK